MRTSGWLEGISLAPYTTFGIGGPADWFIAVRSRRALIEAVRCGRERGIPVFILGGGSNLLVSDLGVRALVVRNEMRSFRHRDGVIAAYSGVSLSTLVRYACRRGLEGLEFAAGIPGTLGGAIYGNAGAWGAAVGDLVEEAELLAPSGELVTVGREELSFGYRTSRLKTSGEILMKATLRLTQGDPAVLAARIEEIMKARAARHPCERGCAGSFFKNVCEPGGGRTAAGALLEECGAKGLSVGGAAVYSGHANFIVNRGGASASDVRALATLLKERVQARFAIALEEEVQFLGEP